MPWRTEPGIDKERQRYLGLRREVAPDIEKGIHPFRDENGSFKRTRADVEWLLSIHENLGMTGPVDWSDPHQRERGGMNLQEAYLCGVDLSGMPLARADMSRAHLDQAIFRDARLEHASLYGANGMEAVFYSAHMHRANLTRSQFRKGGFGGADLKEATFGGADLRQANFAFSDLRGANLPDVRLGGADLRRCEMNTNADLSNVRLGDKDSGFACVADALWGDANVAAIAWSVDDTGSQSGTVNRHVILGDENVARNPPDIGHIKFGLHYGFSTAIRAYRQLATVLRNQGATEQADELIYRALLLRKHVLFRERRWMSFIGSTLLNLLSGYGYRLINAFVSYAVVISAFAACIYSTRTSSHRTFRGMRRSCSA
jgi:hypothetical protein